ncbi:MAG: 4Fe-4S dicluster domain-containing protein [Bacteroidales bacterium]|jgi:molybdopterin-containing oxidoreductase family iron-sulfur binding subunit
MSANEDKPTKKSRRDFLQQIGVVGLGSVLGGSAILAGINYDNKKKATERVKILTAENQLMEVEKSALSTATKPKAEDLAYLQKHGREGLAGKRWVMVIDLSKCRNARKCMAACQDAHHLRPEQHHLNVLKMQESKDTPAFYMPKPCQHCDNPPCVPVCPVDATFKRQDGIVLIDNERCIGCRFCIAACPYSARIFNWSDPLHNEEDKDLTYNVELNVPQRKGTVSKCVFSADRLREEKLPYCVSACPNGVYYFGDENEDSVTNGTTKETFRFKKLLEDNGGYTLMPELGTKPRVYYLPPKGKEYPFQDKDKEEAAEHLS